MHDKITASWLVERNALIDIPVQFSEKGEQPGNKAGNKVQNGRLFSNRKFLLFKRLVEHYQ